MNTLNEAPPASIETGRDFDGSHWYEYTAAGIWEPLYKEGGTFTLREARKLHADGRIVVPSVTTIMGVMAKRQLEKWKMDNVAGAAFDMAFNQPAQAWTREQFIEQAVTTASGASRGAMDLGTRIHKAIQDYIEGKEYDADMQVYVDVVAAKRREMNVTDSIAEECMGSARFGYAGRCDDYSKNGMVIRDLKSRRSKGKKVPTYETDALQLSAYLYARFGNAGFTNGRGEIWGLSTTTPGLLTVHEFSGQELVAAFECFLSLLKVWQHINDFKPNAQ